MASAFNSLTGPATESAKIRVLFAIGSLGGGGSERQMVGILKYLDRSRFLPFLYLIYRRGELLPEVPPDVPVFAFSDRHGAPRSYWPGRIHRMQGRDLAAVLREQQIEVLYDRTFHMTLIAAAASRRVGLPRISMAVTDPARDLEQPGERFVGIKRRLLRKAYLHADRVLAVSEGVRAGLSEYYGLPAERVHVTGNFLDVPRIHALADQPAPAWESGGFHIVTAGRLHQQKGYPYLLRALEELVHHRNQGNVRLHILGVGPLDAELRGCAQQLRLDDHVSFEGFIANPFPLFRKADLFCSPSLYEGAPNVLMEAMLCGVPIVATDCPSGPREILAGGQHGDLVPPADSAALAGAIEDAILHQDRWRARAHAARVAAEKNWSPQAGIARLEAMLVAVSRGED